MRSWLRRLFRSYVRVCTVPDAHASSPLAPLADAALAAARVDRRPRPGDAEAPGRPDGGRGPSPPEDQSARGR
ncbi:hypothetical protein [Streptomyces sp. PTD5-9]|uniref:hypothetical protein n=1 Tax=Streptomyces sp. PTD5-9 TaxID=3120150 RepID=UPI003009F575